MNSVFSLIFIHIDPIRWPISIIRASASGAVDSGSILSLVKEMISKFEFTASLLDTQHYKDSVENKPASLPVVPLGVKGTTPLRAVNEWQLDNL